jgi:hypothetical protein
VVTNLFVPFLEVLPTIPTLAGLEVVENQLEKVSFMFFYNFDAYFPRLCSMSLI